MGWYTDAALTKAFTALDYENPADLSLYAKYEAGNTPVTSDSDSGTSAGGSGGNSERSGAAAWWASPRAWALLGVAAAIALRKRK